MELARAMGSSLSQLPDDIEAGTASGVSSLRTSRNSGDGWHQKATETVLTKYWQSQSIPEPMNQKQLPPFAPHAN
jgi:hypothetical protein